MKKKFVLIAALIAALAVVFTGCWDDLHGGAGSGGGGGGGGAWDLTALKALPGGITLGVGGSTSPVWDATNKVVSVTGSSSSMFYFGFSDVPITVSGGDTLKITYACVIESGQGKVILKNGKNSWSDFSPAQYPAFTSGQSNIMTITSSTFNDGISFQHNEDGNSGAKYHIKILSVTK
jgi:hypothetical protein